jgi:serine/threonine-protein kinase
MIGRTIDGRYTVVRLLGQGAMGAVYEARHAGTGRRVALKVILDAGPDRQHVVRFHREARAVGGVESDHIAQVFDTGTDTESNAPYIAMEFLEGEDLEHVLVRLGPLPVDLALRITHQACLGLVAAHGAGVVHRDIKPANIFLVRRPDGQRVVKLLDFGVAKVTHAEDNHQLTRTGALMGSPLYMSPEQARGSGQVDLRTDLWSLGITLFESLTGRRLNEDATGLGDLLIAICTKPAPPIEAFAPWVPPEVSQIIARALRIDPAERYPDASSFASAIAALLPLGNVVTEPMLVSLDPALAATRNAGVGASQPPPLVSSSRPSVPQTALAGSAPPRTSSLPPPRVGTAASGAGLGSSAMVPPTTLGNTGGAAVAPGAPSRTGLVLGVAALVLAVGGVGVFLAMGRPSPAPTPASDTRSQPTSPATITVAPPPTPPANVVVGQASASTSAASPAALASASAAPQPSAPPAATPAAAVSPATKRPPVAATPTVRAPTPPTTRKTDDDETSRK